MKCKKWLLLSSILMLGLTSCGKTQNDIVSVEEQITQDIIQSEAEISGTQSIISNNDKLQDGDYYIEVTLEGGSGRATVENPTLLRVNNQNIEATIVWSSPNYDYMIVNGQKYEPINTEGNSTFIFPIKEFNEKIKVIADTTAMSTPHEIEYTLYFDSATITSANHENSKINLKWDELHLLKSMEMRYASQFEVDYYENNIELVKIHDGGTFLVVPAEINIVENLPKEVILLHKPIDNIYLVASSALDFFATLNGIDAIALSGVKESDCYIEEIKNAMSEKSILYAGKYNAPDYELLLSNKCELAIENTMIFHNPEVKEQLEKLNIPVLVDHASYEDHPLGRMEWIKLYGALIDKEDEATSFYNEQVNKIESILDNEDNGKKVAFFYVTSNNAISIRKPGDYISKIIEIAGGENAFNEIDVSDESKLSTMKIQMEEFYANAKDADILIYNSTITGEMTSIDDLIKKSSLFEEFAAVKNKKVYVTTQNMYQKTTGMADLIEDMSNVIHNQNVDQLTFLYPIY